MPLNLAVMFNRKGSVLDRADAARDVIATEALKRPFDLIAASMVLLAFLPLLALVAGLVLVAQGRPVMIRHTRVGRNGTTFGCLKFRTMVVDAEEVLHKHLAADPVAEEEWRLSRKLKADPRITPLGRVLRKTSIDEFPQLINILRGDMSLVGPRPIVQDELKWYGASISAYLAVRPGLTGSWQVSGRSNLSYEQRVEIDTHYVQNRSFGRDLVILAQTIPAILTSRGSC